MLARDEPSLVSLATVAREWGRIGCIGFGGPPAHIALLRRLCVDDRGLMSDEEFEQGLAACNLLPGPASTQLAIYCAWRVRGRLGALVGGCCFIAPGLVLILVLAAVFLAARPPRWLAGAAAGAGAAVPAIALGAAWALLPASWRRAGADVRAQRRIVAYLVVSAAAAATIGPYLVIALLGCGLVELAVRHPRALSARGPLVVFAVVPVLGAGSLAAVCVIALKVGALSYGGGFVIVPLMQHDAVDTYHLMSAGNFLTAVALGQITPGPVVQTVAVVGYAARGLLGGVIAAVIAFAPSFAFVLLGGPHLDRLRRSTGAQAFLTGAGAAAIGAIAGATIPLGLALAHLWQLGVLAVAIAALFALRRSGLVVLLGAAALGTLAVGVGAPIG